MKIEKWEIIDTVLPAPLGPTIRVKGLKKVMTFLFSGSKLRIPFISILSTVLIVSPFSVSPTAESRGYAVLR